VFSEFLSRERDSIQFRGRGFFNAIKGSFQLVSIFYEMLISFNIL